MSNARPPLFQQLAQSLRDLIADGTLRPGDRLPSVRALARQRGVNPTSIVRTYAFLENAGDIEVRPQSGHFVAARTPALAPPRRRKTRARVASPAFVPVSELSVRVRAACGDARNYPFGIGAVDAALYPSREIATAIATAARSDPGLIGNYGNNWAHESLARELARRYLRLGLVTSHDDYVITTGSTEAFNLALRAVAKPGDSIAVQSPVYYGFLQVIQGLGLKVIEIPAAAETGLDLSALRTAVERHAVKALMLTTAFANPHGVTLSDAQKRRLCAFLRRHSLPAIEDEVFADLHHGAERPKPLKFFDEADLVMLCSSLGKTLAPGLRLGWLIAGQFQARVQRLRFSNSLGVPPLLQKALADFLRDGGYDRQLRRIRRSVAASVARHRRAILREFPADTAVNQPEGGIFLWLTLPPRADATLLFERALAHGISIAPGEIFSLQSLYPRSVRLNCSRPWDALAESHVAQLGALARECLPR